MLRIAVITSYFPASFAPTDGRSAYEVIRVLSRSCVVRVFYPVSAYPSFLKSRIRTGTRIDCSFTVPDVDATYHTYSAFPCLSRPLNGFAAANALLPQIRKFAPDLIYAILLYPTGYAGLKIAKELGVPVVVEAIGSDLHHIGDPISAFFTRKVLRESNYLFTVSESLRTLALPMGARPDESRAFPNGCNLSDFKPGDRQLARRKLDLPAHAKVIVYVGRMDTRKGLRELVEAGCAIHGRRPDVQVYLVGNGPDRSIVETAIKNAGASGFIHTVPGCPFEEVPVWMTASDVVTLPSYAEGCPNTVVEALACGRPVVATNVGGIPEILSSECGVLVPSKDIPALTDALDSTLTRQWDADLISAHVNDWRTAALGRLRIFEALTSSPQLSRVTR